MKRSDVVPWPPPLPIRQWSGAAPSFASALQHNPFPTPLKKRLAAERAARAAPAPQDDEDDRCPHCGRTG